MSGFSPIDRLIRERLQSYHLEQGVKAKQSVSLWERVAGPTVAAVTRADGIRGGILYVLTRSSAWSQELSMLREPLIARINAELETEAVQDIRFQVKHFPKAAPEARSVPSARDLTEPERAALRRLAERLEDTTAGRIAAVAEKQMRHTDAERACPVCGGPVRHGEPVCPFCREE
jgi:predicted nucleic acid-binding Zn ribbon protein